MMIDSGRRQGAAGPRGILNAAAAGLLALLLMPAIATAQNAGPLTPGVSIDEEEDEQAEALEILTTADRGAAASPLAPAPTSSPRQTFASFRALAQGAADSLVAAFELSADDDALFDSVEVRALKQQALKQLNRAASTLDLSAIPPANRRTVGITSVLLLEEIMDRIPLPDIDAIPDEAAVDSGVARTGWTVPGTEIRMVQVPSPDGEPRFLFSSDTIQQLPTFYVLVRDLPRHSSDQIDFYQHFVTAPGLSMPVELYRYVLGFPDWMLEAYDEQAVWQWIALAILTALVIGTTFFVLRWEGRRAESVSAVTRSLQRLFPPLFVIALLALYDWLLDDFINLTGDVFATVELVVESLQAFALAFAAVLGFNVLAALIIASPRVSKESLDASLIRLILRVIGIAFAGYIIFVGATRVGIPVYGVIAGLGVGGLAIALAVRPTLENFIGGIILYADRPVKVGDFCKFGDMLGTVETIGLRSTKIRGLDRTLVTVQNADFAQMSITNFTRRDANLMHTTIGLRYETAPEQLSGIIEGIAQMLRADQRVDPTSVRVCFRGFGDYSLEVEIWAYVKSADWGRFLKIQEDLFMQVMAIVAQGGSAFAFPSQTTYLGSDHPPGASGASPRRPASSASDHASSLPAGPQDEEALAGRELPAGAA